MFQLSLIDKSITIYIRLSKLSPIVCLVEFGFEEINQYVTCGSSIWGSHEGPSRVWDIVNQVGVHIIKVE